MGRPALISDPMPLAAEEPALFLEESAGGLAPGLLSGWAWRAGQPAGNVPVELLADTVRQAADELAAMSIGDPPPLRKRWDTNLFVAQRMIDLGLACSAGDLNDRDMGPGFVKTRTLRQDGRYAYVECTASDYLPRVIWHWWLDGKYFGRTRGNTYVFTCRRGRTISVHAKPVRYSSYRGQERDVAPLFGEVLLQWLPSAQAVDHYIVQYRIVGAGSWTNGPVRRADGRWPYTARLAQLADDTSYEFQVVPVDSSGNQGTALALGSLLVVRWPDAPDPEIALNGTQQWVVDVV